MFCQFELDNCNRTNRSVIKLEQKFKKLWKNVIIIDFSRAPKLAKNSTIVQKEMLGKVFILKRKSAMIKFILCILKGI